jgi:hypothetical protein
MPELRAEKENKCLTPTHMLDISFEFDFSCLPSIGEITFRRFSLTC